MAQVSRSRVSLRIMGESLIPSEISKLLGRDGTTMYTKGDVFTSKTVDREVTRASGHWSLATQACEPENLDGQVREILDQLTDDLDIWGEVSTTYRCDIFCGLFLKESNEGMDISPSTLKLLGERGISLSLDIYDGS